MSEYILDVLGLREWALLTGNEFGAVAAAVADGRCVILSRVWQEFETIYPDHAKVLNGIAKARQKVTQADRIRAAALAQHLNATFGPYDEGLDWVVAGRALLNSLVVVTAPPSLRGFYGKIEGCKAVSAAELLVATRW